MSLNPRVCKKSYKVHIPMMGEACEFWLITVTDEQSITNPDKDHAYLTDDGKLFVFNGDSLVRVNCDICFTQEEREKLEGIEEGANKYVLPVASSTELGGVLLGYTQNGRNYPITKDTKGNIYVNVPWEEYQLPKATDDALGGIKTGYKQNGKFYPIKTDTDGNAYVQVPWEDTNTVYEVVSKTSNGLMPMLPSDENASKRFLNGDGEWVVGTDNSINGVTQTGSTFSGETSDCGVEITKVVGKTTQQTTNGYQLFDTSKVTNKYGLTVTHEADGSFTLNGKTTGTYDSYIINEYGSTDIAITSGLKLKANVTNTNIRVIVGNGENELANLPLSTNEQSFNVSDIAWVIFRIYSGTSVSNLNLKPMLYQDGDGTWEPFTGGKPAPNPDYAMDIENVEITKINSGTNQLFDASKISTKTHEPFHKNTVETNLTLAEGDIYQQGTITRARKQVTFDGSSDENWTYDSGSLRFGIIISDSILYTDKRIPVICNRGVFRDSGIEVGTTFIGANHLYYYTPDRSITRVQNFKKWLQTHPVTVEYQLATPTTEEFKVPTIPSYEPYTEISTNSVVDPTITFRPLPFTTCLVGEATEEESGYMPPLSGNSNEFLNGSGEWSVPSGYTLPTASSSTLGGVKIGENITISSGTISIDKEDVTGALGYTPPTANTTYEKVDKSSDGLCPKLPNETTTTKYLRQDGAWAVPPNTTYGVASTSSNGLMSSSDKTKLTNLRRIWKGTSSSPPSGWVDGDIYVQYEE